MLVVRYGTLVALVLWLGAMLGSRFWRPPRACCRRSRSVCGAIIVIGLFAMKFIGPPPPAFFPRVALVLSCWRSPASRPGWRRAHGAVAAVVNMALGFVLLYWYAARVTLTSLRSRTDD